MPPTFEPAASAKATWIIANPVLSNQVQRERPPLIFVVQVFVKVLADHR